MIGFGFGDLNPITAVGLPLLSLPASNRRASCRVKDPAFPRRFLLRRLGFLFRWSAVCGAPHVANVVDCGAGRNHQERR